MSSPPISPDECRRAVEEVNRLLREGRLSMEAVASTLSEAELTLLQQSPSDGTPIPGPSYARIQSLLASATVDPTPPKPIILNSHGTVAHEILAVRLLLIGFDAPERLQICELIDEATDTHFQIAHTHRIDLAPALARQQQFDVALVNLASAAGGGIADLARPELRALDIPLVSVIRREDEPQALHLGDRSYLVKSQLTAALLVRSVRSSIERHTLTSQVEVARQREQFHATRDSMTGLPNREHFRSRLAHAISHAERHDGQIAVLFLDLDRFKLINDTLGHQAGDSLLITMSIRLASCLRRSDLVARVGGDEFLMLLLGEDLSFAPSHTAEKVLKSLDTPFLLEGKEHSVTGSIGIATFPRDGNDPDDLIRKADAAMYQAKSLGRNRFRFYSQTVDAVAMRKLTLESKLRRVLETDALELYFQPRLETQSGRILGAEALLRWNDPELGQISPDEFIPVAEESGQIVPIGDWTIRRACEQLARWRDDGHDMRVSVNLSARQLAEASLRESVVQALWETGTPAERLELEITESALIQNHDVAARVLQELTSMGLRLSLDDFGTGFSSLSYLRRFPVDLLKIDQSFIHDVLDDPDDAAITEAIISIAHKLRLRVVAEGVETLEQYQFLRSRGCHEVQGYLFSPPVSAAEFEALLKKPSLL